jgi:hypothetical protein
MSKKTKNNNVAGRRGPGRPPGSRNKFTTLKDDWLWVHQAIGGRDRLKEFAEHNLRLFYQLESKLFPQEQEHTGKDGGPIEFNVTWNGNH